MQLFIFLKSFCLVKLLYKDVGAWQRPVLTEEKGYELFKDVPLKADVTFLSAAWATLIDQLDYGNDEGQAAARKTLKDLEGLQLTNSFTICQHDRFHLLLPLFEKIGVTTVFAPHMSNGAGYITQEYYFTPSSEGSSAIGSIQIEPFFLYPVCMGSPLKEKDIWYSFVGAFGGKYISPIRQVIFDDTHPSNAICVERKGWQFDIEVYEAQIGGREVSAPQEYINRQKEEFYKRTLSRSRFALCPSGTGPALIRLLEALGSGAIPVVLSDNMMFPTIKGINWEECCITIQEKDYNTLRDVLSGVTPEEEKKMRERCLEAYELTSGDNYVRSIREHYDGSS